MAMAVDPVAHEARVHEELIHQGIRSVVTEVRSEHKVIVSPLLAEWFLDHGHPNQRGMPPGDIVYYKHHMEAGTFVEYVHPGIYMSRRGEQCNAQTRLAAQVQCGCTLGWRLVLGASDEEIAVIDDVRRRRPHQTLGLLGRVMSSRAQSVYRAYERLLRSHDVIATGNTRLGPAELDLLRSEWGADVDWAIEQWPDRVSPASMVAALAYARPVMPGTIEGFAVGYSRARLAMAIAPGAANSPALVLARFMNGAKPNAGGQIHSVELMNRALSALRAHAEGRELAYLYGNKDTAKPLRFFKDARKAAGLSG